MTAPSEVLFESLEDGAADVVMESTESRDDFLILHLDSFIEQYLLGVAHIHVHVRACPDLEDRFRSVPWLKSLVMGGQVADVALSNAHGLNSVSNSKSGDLPVFIPVGCFIEKPEGVLVHWTFPRVWAQIANVNLCSGDHVLDPTISDSNSKGGTSARDGERDIFFLLRRHGDGGVGLTEGEGEIVETIAETLESVSNHQTKLIWERLDLFCHESNSPLAIGLIENSVTAVINPSLDKVLGLVNVELCPRKLSAVAQ